MNRHDPQIKRTTVSGTVAKIYEPPTNARSIPALVENHADVVVRLLFTDTGSGPNPDEYISLSPGHAKELNPNLAIYAYTPSGAPADVVVCTGVRHIGPIGAAGESGLTDAADLLVELRNHKQLRAEGIVIGRLILKYLAEMLGEEFKESDALEI